MLVVVVVLEVGVLDLLVSSVKFLLITCLGFGFIFDIGNIEILSFCCWCCGNFCLFGRGWEGVDVDSSDIGSEIDSCVIWGTVTFSFLISGVIVSGGAGGAGGGAGAAATTIGTEGTVDCNKFLLLFEELFNFSSESINWFLAAKLSFNLGLPLKPCFFSPFEL